MKNNLSLQDRALVFVAAITGHYNGTSTTPEEIFAVIAGVTKEEAAAAIAANLSDGFIER